MTFQPPSKSLTPRDYQFIAVVTVVFLIISAALVYTNLSLRGGGEFYVHWVGARAFTFDKIEPYSGDVAARVQQLVYGGPAQAGQEAYILDTPFHLLILYFPFTLLSDPALARAIFTWILELALFVLAWLSYRLTDWESPRFFAVLLVIFGIFNFYSFEAIYEAGPILLLGLFYAGILLSLRAEMDELAGALIALSCYYWEAGAPFLLLVFLRVYHEQRTRVLAGFFMLSFLLLAVSFLLYPDWIIPFLRAGINNLHTGSGFTVFTALSALLPVQGRLLAWGVVVLLIVALGYEWSTARYGDFRRFYWASCLSLAAAPLLGFRTEMENLSVLAIPLAFVFAVVYERWRKIGAGLTTLLVLIIFSLPWALFFFLPSFKFNEELLFLFPPLFTVIGLYWIRWWALRPPRTWIDLANSR